MVEGGAANNNDHQQLAAGGDDVGGAKPTRDRTRDETATEVEPQQQLLLLTTNTNTNRSNTSKRVRYYCWLVGWRSWFGQASKQTTTTRECGTGCAPPNPATATEHKACQTIIRGTLFTLIRLFVRSIDQFILLLAASRSNTPSKQVSKQTSTYASGEAEGRADIMMSADDAVIMESPVKAGVFGRFFSRGSLYYRNWIAMFILVRVVVASVVVVVRIA